MKGLGRILALPFLMLALLVQGFAPAQAATMPRDAFGQPICTLAGVSKPGDPQKAPAQSHDCCAAACQAMATPLSPPTTVEVTVEPPSAPAVFALRRASALAPRGPPPRPIDATGPPSRA